VKTDPAERGPAIAALRQEFTLANGRGGGRAAAPAATRPCPVEGAPAGPGGPPSPVPGFGAQAGGRGGRGGRGGATAGVETLTPDRRAEFDRRLADIDRKWPAAPRATVKDFVDHIDYAVKLIGVDHVGISSDFDGGGGVDGWNSAAETFNVTLELVRRGYTEEQIGKIWSGNLLRVWADAEKIAKDIQAGRR
jgi:membrane dipeptidase